MLVLHGECVAVAAAALQLGRTRDEVFVLFCRECSALSAHIVWVRDQQRAGHAASCSSASLALHAGSIAPLQNSVLLFEGRTL